MENDINYFGGGFKTHHSNIGEVVSFVPRYQVGGNGVRNVYFPRQRLGFGWGSTILSFFKPLLKRGLKGLLNVASNVASDALEGQNVKESLKKHGLEGVSNLLKGDQIPSPSQEETVKQIIAPVVKRAVSASVIARRKPKVVRSKLKKNISGGKSKNQKLKQKFPILDFM